jgi:hypothetical protein
VFPAFLTLQRGRKESLKSAVRSDIHICTYLPAQVWQSGSLANQQAVSHQPSERANWPLSHCAPSHNHVAPRSLTHAPSCSSWRPLPLGVFARKTGGAFCTIAQVKTGPPTPEKHVTSSKGAHDERREITTYVKPPPIVLSAPTVQNSWLNS